MKELSIEEKAQRYDEALKQIKECTPDENGFITIYPQEIFTELKESEGEKIRKDIIWCLKHSGIKESNPINPHVTTILKDAIAWLEKQSKQLQGKSALEAAKEEKVDNQNCVKPNDKVEPEFKVGDFIVNDYCVGRVVELTNDAYLLDTGQGIPFSGNSTRLWDITKDARGGDVLYLQKDGKEHIIIYKGVIKERFTTFVSAYCAYNGIVDAFCFADVSRYVDIAYRGIIPATKEQRDTLMKAMADAGYTFDFKKKELKKVEQKPDDKSKIKSKFKAGDRVIGIVSGIPYFITKVCNDHYNTESGCIIMFYSQDNFELYEQNPAWSEEDEKMIKKLIDFMLSGIDISKAPYGCVAWLKSLRPQWKPSDEQMGVIEAVINNRSFQRRHLDSLYADLKKLRKE